MKRRHVHLWKQLAQQESKALRELYKAYGRLPATRPLQLPILEQKRLALVLAGSRTLDDGHDLELIEDDACGEARGTERGHARHRRWKQTPCQACLKAHSSYVGQQKRAKREKRNESVSS